MYLPHFDYCPQTLFVLHSEWFQNYIRPYKDEFKHLVVIYIHERHLFWLCINGLKICHKLIKVLHDVLSVFTIFFVSIPPTIYVYFV